MTEINLLQLHQVPILHQLQIEEALLRTDSTNWCIVNHGSAPAIVMGISGKEHELIHMEKLEQAPIPLIRRFSGGGTVFIDENTIFITFICDSSSLKIEPFPRHIMNRFEKLYQPIFHPHPFRLEENDYVLGHRKFGGNAQSICKGRWLHHSSLLWDYDAANMDYLLMPRKTPTYRQGRPHTDFLCCLKDYWKNKALFINKFLDQLKCDFEVKNVPNQNIEEILSRPHRQATTVIK